MDQFEHLILPLLKSILELMLVRFNGRRPFLDQIDDCPNILLILVTSSQPLLDDQSGGFQELMKIMAMVQCSQLRI